MAKLGVRDNTVLFSMHRRHTQKAETRRHNGCAAEEEEEGVDGEVGDDATFHDIWFDTVRHHGHVIVARRLAWIAFGIAGWIDCELDFFQCRLRPTNHMDDVTTTQDFSPLSFQSLVIWGVDWLIMSTMFPLESKQDCLHSICKSTYILIQ
jgi:hypothetical protein